MPAAFQPHSNLRVSLDVAHVLGVLSEFGDEPELVADPTATERCLPGLAGLSTGGLEQGLYRNPRITMLTYF